VAKEPVAPEAPAAGGGAAPAEPKRRVSRGLLLFVILPLVLLLAGGAGYYFFFFKKAQEAAQAEKPPPPPKTYVFYNLPGFVVNLPAAAGRTSFLKVTISLELDSQADVPKVQAVMPRIVDHVQAYLRELRPEDVRGTAGIQRMRQEMLDRVTEAAPGAKVDDVLLQELLLQ
jgi:flagellar FliL protein